MNEKQLSNPKAEYELLSKEVIKLPPIQRLVLLLKAKRYPIVKKRTSAEGQIREMIAFYELCCLMLAQFFQNEQAENNFLLLSFIDSQENIKLVANVKFAEALRLLRNYEEMEEKVTAIQNLFYRYRYFYPELYESYNLESRAIERISDVIQSNKRLMKDNPQLVEKILNRWELLS